jgi:nickel/cobalt transporter (NicO) family protein
MLGSLHAFEADHMAAVTSFVVRRPRPGDAVRFGLQWALGHGGAILIAGAFLLFVGLAIPENATGIMERLVGVALILLGLSTAWAAHRAHVRSHIHKFSNSQIPTPTAIGLMHGLAGAAPAVALVPLAVVDSAVSGLAYLLLFALGTAISMAAYAAAAGFFAGRASGISERFGRNIGRLTGLSTIAIGIFWLIR